MRKLLRAVRLGEDRVRQLLRLHESSGSRERAAQKFWTRPPEAGTSFWWHMRGGTAYSDEQWLSIGRRHVELFRKLSGVSSPLNKVAEWGCGGGANAVAFAKDSRNFFGIEVSQPSLDECAKQLVATQAIAAFHQVLIDVPAPESALKLMPRDLDLLVSFYVFEVFPSKEYTERVLKVIHQLLRPGGHAFLQVKYETDSWKTRSRNWGYTRGAANMTTYRIDEFWSAAQTCGFEPVSVSLVPKPVEVPDERYAYFLLRKPETVVAMAA